MNKGINLEGTANSIFMLDFHRIPLFSRKLSNVPEKAWLFKERAQNLELEEISILYFGRKLTLMSWHGTYAHKQDIKV